jgi:hypothetical protein
MCKARGLDGLLDDVEDVFEGGFHEELLGHFGFGDEGLEEGGGCLPEGLRVARGRGRRWITL